MYVSDAAPVKVGFYDVFLSTLAKRDFVLDYCQRHSGSTTEEAEELLQRHVRSRKEDVVVFLPSLLMVEFMRSRKKTTKLVPGGLSSLATIAITIN